MMDEKALSVALHELAGPDDTGPAPINSLLRRGRRARFHRMARTAGVTAAAVALAAGVAAVARPTEPGPVPLKLAAQTTQLTTFQFRQTLSLKSPTGETVLPANIPANEPYRGAYDPIHERGYRIQVIPGEPRLTYEERQIGDVCYVHHVPRDPWYASSMSGKPPACWRLTGAPERSALGVSANPRDLLAELEEAGQVSYAGRSGEGKHRVDTYRFTYRYTIDLGQRTGAGPTLHRTVEKRGTVAIDVTTRRIFHLAYDSADVTGDGHRFLAVSQDLALSGFGTPVMVEKPTDVATR